MYLTLIMHSLLLLLLDGVLDDGTKLSELSSPLPIDEVDGLPGFKGDEFPDGLRIIFSSHKGTFTPWSRNQSRNAVTCALGSST